MKELYARKGPAGADRGHLAQLMEAAYYLQRKGISASPAPSIVELRSGWPYLFTQKELYNHFKLLTDISILEKMDEAIEDRGKMIVQFATATPADVERSVSLAESPRLIVQGGTLTSVTWMMRIEGQVVLSPQPNFVAGLATLFASFYNFNLEYQEEASCMLEFIQRTPLQKLSAKELER
ncbi:hypothetical protein AOLI_G00036300 [Acnodon oligacanthus]